MRVSLLQFAVHAGDRASNHAAVRRLVRCAVESAEPPAVVVLPELWSTGYALDQAAELASPGGRDDARFLGGLAREFGVTFAGGSVLAAVPAEAAGRPAVRNRAQVVGADGIPSAFYDKVHLFRPMGEDRHLAAGGGTVLFSLCGVRCSCVTCYDIRFCELVRRVALEGAELLFVDAEWPAARIVQWEILLRARAVENQMFVAACNRCGVSCGEVFGGRSMIVAPDGSVLAQAGDGEQVISADVDPDAVRALRRRMPVFSDRVPAAY